MVDQLKPEMEQELGTTFATFQATDYSAQVVAGMIYLVRILVGTDETLHVKIFQPLPYTGLPPELQACQRATLDAPLLPM